MNLREEPTANFLFLIHKFRFWPSRLAQGDTLRSRPPALSLQKTERRGRGTLTDSLEAVNPVTSKNESPPGGPAHDLPDRRSQPEPGAQASPATSASAYLGFDRNDYPGDANLKSLRQTFSYAGFWLNQPPGEKANTWAGKRQAVQSAGFGFLVLFNGRLFSQLKTA